VNPDPHTWTQSRAAGKLYELEQRLNAMQTPQEASVPAATPKKRKRTAKQRQNDRIMKKTHVHLKQLKARTNKFGKKGTINKSQTGAAMKEARRRAKKEMGIK
jgi:hypothetical protein